MTRNQIAWQQAMEEQRANKAREVETNRHNLETEKLGWAQLEEQIRYNTQWLGETVRHNKVVEQETHRHNLATEANQRYAAQLQYAVGMAGVEATRERNRMDLTIRSKQMYLDRQKFDFSKQTWQQEYDWKLYSGMRDINIRETANDYTLLRTDKQGAWNLGGIVTRGIFDSINNMANNASNIGGRLLPFILGG